MKPFVPALVLLLWSGSAAAQSPTDPPRDITVSGGVTAVSDYRFRGISHSDRRPALQGGVTIDHLSGVYGRVWASSIHDYVAGNAPAEVDLTAGYRRSFGGVTLDGGVLYYLYPDAAEAATDFFEPFASVSYTLGPVTAKLGASYAPRQSALSVGRGREDNLYLSGDLSGFVPGTPVTVSAHLGHNSGPTQLGLTEDYTDWSLAANYTLRGLTFGLAYVDTDARVRTPRGRNAAGAGVVASVAFGF